MKIKSFSALLFFSLTFCFSMAQNKKESVDYLVKVLDNLNKIESASYVQDIEGYQPGDTASVSKSCRFVKEFNNPNDTTIGSKFVVVDCDDKTKLTFGYDGKVRALIYPKKKEIVIDDFTASPLPFRPIGPPFFNYTKNILFYYLNTQDKIKSEIIDKDDYLKLKITIEEDKQVEFFGGPHYIDVSQFYGDNTSIYEIWISKSNNLPYKVRREMSHEISIRSCREAELNTLDGDNFDLYSYFPTDYTLVKYLQKANKQQTSPMIGKIAPKWQLTDMNGKEISLSDIHSKVIVLNFTGIGCGPCKMAIPFLNNLKEKYSEDDAIVVSIENWKRQQSSLQHYAKQNNIQYLFVQANDSIISEYEVGLAAPVFFILDKDRIIKKVLNGYSQGNTDKEITQTINTLL